MQSLLLFFYSYFFICPRVLSLEHYELIFLKNMFFYSFLFPNFRGKAVDCAGELPMKIQVLFSHIVFLFSVVGCLRKGGSVLNKISLSEG